MSSANNLIEKLPDAFVPELASGLKMTVQFMIEEPMYAVIGQGICRVHHGQAESPDLVVTLADDDLVKLMTGRLNGLTAYMTGRLKVKGDLINARKLPSIFDRKRFR